MLFRALTRLEVSVEGKENATEDQVLPYHVIGHYEDGSQSECSASDIHLDASSTDGGHLEVNGLNLLLYTKGSVTGSFGFISKSIFPICP